MKAFILFFFLFYLTTSGVFGQIAFLKQPYDYGLISSNNQYVDIPIKNTSDKKIFIFRADVDKRFQLHYSNKTILPDSTVYVRVQFNPTKKGAFTEEIPIHFSSYDVPKSIKITGFAEEISSSTIACPSFSQEQQNNDIAFDFQVKVIDKVTREPLDKATVLLVSNGIVSHELMTNKMGIKTKKVDLGLYYFVASKEGYNSQEFPKYINKKTNSVLFELERNEEQLAVLTPPIKEKPVITAQPQEEKPIEQKPIEVIEETPFDEEEELVLVIEKEIPKEEEKEVIEAETPIEPKVIEQPEIETEEKYPEFPLSVYKPNNIVFLIDVSASMKYTGKLDLLKASMIEMTNLLRDIDKITMVTYASGTIVEMEAMSASFKDSIIQKIKGLEAKGMTAGGKGLKLAYTKASESFISDGNNEVIMATDGDLNSGNENIYKLSKKYYKKGIKLSVLGIKNRPTHEENMRKLAQSGGGNYLRIDSFEDAKTELIQEVKISSRF